MAAKGIIIEAGQYTRSLDTRSSQPKSLDIEKNSNKQVLEWIVSSLKANKIHEITYIGNYHIEKVIKRFPHLNYVYYTQQDANNEVQALNLYNYSSQDDLFIIRSDIVLLPSALQFEPSESISIFYASDQMTLEDLALIYIPHNQVSSAFHKLKANNFTNFHEMGDKLELPVNRVILEKKAASISKPHLLSQVIFQGKGKTLENIAPLLTKSIVLDQIRFSYREWQQNSNIVLEKIQSTFYARKVVVRSNTKSEDSLVTSHAGAFLSLLDINPSDTLALKSAIEEVIASYSKNQRVCLELDEILVQPQVENIKSSGVLLTREPRTGSPYFVLSIDATSGRSDTVTSGTTEHIDNYYVARDADVAQLNPDIIKIINAGRELLNIARLDSLDIEFCIDNLDNIYLLQVRPLVIKFSPQFKDEEVLTALNELSLNLKDKFGRKSYLSGDSTVFGVMPDWNPAEIVGVTPKPLAISLYQRLVCNQAWAKARAFLGYKETLEPLVYSLSGAPYVDVRKSINSLLPNNLEKTISEDWSNWCINTLKQKPYLHDKVEFEIYVTCLSPNWNKYRERIKDALQSDLKVDSFHQALHQLTSNILVNFEDIIKLQKQKLEKLIENMALCSQDSESIESSCRNVRYLSDDIIHNGIVPFAILARMAFISINYLRDFVEMGVFSEDCKNSFLNAIPTVASRFSDDMNLFQQGNLTLASLVEEYGHLRPNSYDITSFNYAASPKQYFQINRDNMHSQLPTKSPIEILAPYSQTIESILADLRLDINFAQLISFITESISLREYAKFEFMKVVNKILENVSNLGQVIDFDNEKLAYLHIDDILRFETEFLSKASVRQLLKAISFNQKKHSLLCGFMLPEIIAHPKDILAFKMGSWKPNFITLNSAIAEVVWVKESIPSDPLENKIVCIEAADPGYDWIFSHKIAGLITAFGGVASHMAIRAAEFNLPAAIGCGISQFNQIKIARQVELNCQSQFIRVIE